MTQTLRRRSADRQQIADLRQKVLRMQGLGVARPLELLPGLAGVVALHTGSVVAVDGPALAMAVLAGPSQAGEWSAVVGVPEFGYEAAAGLGLDLARTIVVPDPGEHWLSVTAGLADVATVVLVRPPRPVTAAEAERLRSRLRQRDAALLALGGWPRATAELAVRKSRWVGLGQGYGHLTARQVRVAVRTPGRPERHLDLWLPGADLAVRLADPGPGDTAGEDLAPEVGWSAAMAVRAG